MTMATIQLFKNPFVYPHYGELTSYGTETPCIPVGFNLKGGTLRVSGTTADFMSANYLKLTRDGQTIYAWIDDVSFSTADSFNVTYRVDPLRTYRSNINLGRQFIDRSDKITYKKDDLLGSEQSQADVTETKHEIGDPSKRILVVQTHVYSGEFFSNTPVQPTPYRFYFYEYDIHNWAQDTNLNLFISSIMGKEKPENIVTIYSIPAADIDHLDTGDLVIHPSNVSIGGFKILEEDKSMQGKLHNETKLDIGEDVLELLRVDHSVQVVIPSAGIINIPDYMLHDSPLYLRQDIDMFSGAANYMVVSDNNNFTQSVRGSSISSIPIISDPMDTYLSSNQNSLATALIGDVASVGLNVAAGSAAGIPGMAAGAVGGIGSIINRHAGISDMAGRSGNPPAFLGTAMANEFNQKFWVVVTKQAVDNRGIVNSTFGYPLGKVDSLYIPDKGFMKTQNCAVRSDGTVPLWAIDEINSMFDRGILFH